MEQQLDAVTKQLANVQQETHDNYRIQEQLQGQLWELQKRIDGDVNE